MNAEQMDQLLERVIPLPKRAVVTGVRKVATNRCIIDAASSESTVQTAVHELKAALPGSTEGSLGDFVLRLLVLPGDAELTALHNADQAYRIRPTAGGLELAGVTGVGVLYAARTLAQLVHSTSPGIVEIPIATILDWPDMAERGQWGGDTTWQLPNTSALKLNLIEVGVVPHYDETGKLGITLLTRPICAEALPLGVKPVIYVPHLGDLGKYSNIFEQHPELKSTPNPDEPLPADYKPSVCFSKPLGATLVAGIMEEVIRTLAPCGSEMNVWLTEEGTPCFCKQCRGQNPYVMETRLLAAAYHIVKQAHPGFTLRITLTQGSYPYNEQVLSAVPPDMGVTFYSGTHSFDSSHKPMIYPVLEEYARQHWLAVVPQLDNSWRTVFPFTAPQRMRERLREFVGKGLQSVTGYATPSNRFCAFNVAAMAEWAWNADGRDEHGFARAWARRQGMADVEGFAQWASLISPPGWDLAGSRFPMSLFWDPAKTILEKPTPMVYGEGLLAEIPSSEHLEHNITAGRAALAAAQALGHSECVAESQVVLNSYLFLKALVAIAGMPRSGEGIQQRMGEQLAALDAAAELVVRSLWDWGMAVYPDLEQKPPHRFEETMSVFAQVVTEAYRLAAQAGVVDPRPAYRDQPLGRWTEKDAAQGEATLFFAVNDYLCGPGAYRVMFRWLGGSQGADIKSIAFLQDDGQGLREISRTEPKTYGYGDETASPHVGRYEAWNDVLLELPAVQPGARYILEAHLGGLPVPGDAPDEQHTSDGEICLRRSWA